MCWANEPNTPCPHGPRQVPFELVKNALGNLALLGSRPDLRFEERSRILTTRFIFKRDHPGGSVKPEV